jgi:hypothetical protein
MNCPLCGHELRLAPHELPPCGMNCGILPHEIKKGTVLQQSLFL